MPQSHRVDSFHLTGTNLTDQCKESLPGFYPQPKQWRGIIEHGGATNLQICEKEAQEDSVRPHPIRVHPTHRRSLLALLNRMHLGRPSISGQNATCRVIRLGPKPDAGHIHPIVQPAQKNPCWRIRVHGNFFPLHFHLLVGGGLWPFSSPVLV